MTAVRPFYLRRSAAVRAASRLRLARPKQTVYIYLKTCPYDCPSGKHVPCERYVVTRKRDRTLAPYCLVYTKGVRQLFA